MEAAQVEVEGKACQDEEEIAVVVREPGVEKRAKVG